MLLRLKSGLAFIAGFVGVAVSWGIVSGWIDSSNSSILSARIGNLFGGMAPMLVIAMTAVIGGLIGGFGGMTGAALSKLVFVNRDRPSNTT